MLGLPSEAITSHDAGLHVGTPAARSVLTSTLGTSLGGSHAQDPGADPGDGATHRLPVGTLVEAEAAHGHRRPLSTRARLPGAGGVRTGREGAKPSIWSLNTARASPASRLSG